VSTITQKQRSQKLPTEQLGDKGAPTVVLLHGMGQSQRAMQPLRAAIGRAGYRTWAHTYQTSGVDISTLAGKVGDRIAEDLGDGPLLGVCHSLGSILVRHMAQRFDWRGLVMLAPPNQGSSVVRKLSHRKLFQVAFGDVGVQLGDCQSWPDPPKPFAVIAGTKPLSLGNPTSWLTRSLKLFDSGVPHDGTIALDETKHPAMDDFAIIEASHTGLLDHPYTVQLALQFLEHGRFVDAEAQRQLQQQSRRAA
jgi:pimeloyl-ACP methyl ester carboxylesterase